MKLAHRVALVTGAGSGIGKASAVALAREGARVGVVDFNSERAQGVVDEITAGGGEALPLTADVSNPELMAEAVETLVNAWGRLDIAYANAGINGVWTPIDEMEVHDWDQLFAVNLKGTFLTVKYTLPHMRKSGGGSIIVTSSVQGTSIFSIAGSTAYACTKAAQLTFVKKVALEVAKDGIRVNAVRPGPIETNINESTFRRNTEKITFPIHYPEGRIPLTKGAQLPAAEVANAVVFLASDDAKGITGADILVDAGLSLVCP